MNNIIQIPSGFNPPKELVHENYFLEVLAPKHNDMDYAAWTSSRDELQGIFGPDNDWPPYVYSKEENLTDLEKHYREFNEKIAYVHTILSPDKTSCIGCLYIRPTSTQYDARVDFWFTNVSRHFEPQFYEELKAWLKKDWHFTNAVFPGRSLPWKEYNRLVDGKN